MKQKKEHFHGSDLEKIEEAYGIRKEDIISFSANVNPLGISYKLRKELPNYIDAVSSYPDREYTALRKAIGVYVHTEPQNIIVGNGSTELISLVLKRKHPGKALIIGPTYSEYEHEIHLGGGHSKYFCLKESDDFILQEEALFDALTDDINFLVICNPNNPTSSLITRKTMQNILDICKEKNIFVMIDETYVEFSENSEEVTAIPLTRHYDNIIILRGISKFFAAPGLRLGYAVCGNRQLISEINSFKNPWTINSLAAIAGEIMFTDKEYIDDTIQLISTERERICKLLADCPAVKFYPPHANFILLRILKEGVTSKNLFDAAIQKGLMIRDCSAFPSLDDKYIRFCFMNRKDNDALLYTLLEQL